MSYKEQKAHLLEVLKEANYDTTKDEVVTAVNTLSTLWKEDETAKEFSKSPARSPSFLGDWRILSGPNFPNRIVNEDKDTFQYTLGRISFNMFQPKKLVVTICHPENGVLNVVKKSDQLSHLEYEDVSTYNVINNIIIHTAGGDLPAELLVEGHCFPETDTRRKVGFTSGTLRKHASIDENETLQKLWDDTFQDAYAKADQERGYLESSLQWVMKKMMKMTFPTDESMRYEMNRVIYGYLDVLFLDEDLRITKGNRGSIVIMTRE